jgi:uncharacterized phage infection (PIP) family protein YhgE
MLVLTMLCSCMIRETAAPEYFVAEENRLTTQMDNTSNPDVLSDLYASRARLRVRTDNPHPDYRGALRDFESSLNLNPDQGKAGDIGDWIAALRRINELEQDTGKIKAKYEQSERQNRTLTGTVAQLEKTVEQLEKQEKELRKSIEELQSLELQMEKRRGQLR